MRKKMGKKRKEGKEEWMKGTVIFTARIDKEVFDYLLVQVKKERFSSISEAINSLLKEAIRRRRRAEERNER